MYEEGNEKVLSLVLVGTILTGCAAVPEAKRQGHRWGQSPSRSGKDRSE